MVKNTDVLRFLTVVSHPLCPAWGFVRKLFTHDFSSHPRYDKKIIFHKHEIKMFTFTFFKKAVGLGFATALAFSVATAPVIAGNDMPACKAGDKAKIVKIKDLGVPTFDFTNSSTDCLKHYASGLSHKYLVYVAESDSPAWRNATVEAAKIDKQEGIPVAVAFAKDRDGDPKTAATYVWANGSELAIVPYAVKEGYTVEMIVSVLHNTSKKLHEKEEAVYEIHETGHAIYKKYHNRVPPR